MALPERFITVTHRRVLKRSPSKRYNEWHDVKVVLHPFRRVDFHFRTAYGYELAGRLMHFNRHRELRRPGFPDLFKPLMTQLARSIYRWLAVTETIAKSHPLQCS